MRLLLLCNFLLLLVVGLMGASLPSVAANTECETKFGGLCETFCSSNTWGLGKKKFISQGDYGCGITERCCVKGDVYCKQETEGKGSCKALADCPATVGRDPGLDAACKGFNPSTPACCITESQESQCTYSGYNGGTCKSKCDPSTEKSTGAQFDEICKQLGKGSACCEKKMPGNVDQPLAECTNSGGQCVATCDTSTGMNQVLPDNDACKKFDQNAPFCCKSNTTPPTTPPPGSDSSSPQEFSYFKPIIPNSFTELIGSVLAAIQGVVGWLAVLMLVLGGVMYIVSGGSGLASMAKGTITAALVGFAIAVAAPTLLREIYELVSAGGSSGSDVIDGASPVTAIVARVLSFLLSIVGLLAVIGFVVSGLMWTTARGDASQAGAAQKAFQYTLIGIVVSGAGLIIVEQLLDLAFGVQ